MSTVKTIPVTALKPHPKNPRKNIGDVTELADSLKAKGILQNLTVVPAVETGYFTVIIGHRRLAAAKQAGITELPCAVVQMTEEEQLSTMLAENMQRADLTVYEQAEGIQMMLDLGKTADEVADLTGLGRSTVYKRVKLLKLDRDKFAAASDRGATLFDFSEIDKIEDISLKNKLLDSVGTNNFRSDLQRAKEAEEKIKWFNGVITHLREVCEGECTIEEERWLSTGTELKIKTLSGNEKYAVYDGYINEWSNKECDTSGFKPKSWFRIDRDSRYAYIYHELNEEDVQKAEQKNKKEDIAKTLREQAGQLANEKTAEIDGIKKRTFALRSSFMANVGANAPNIRDTAMDYLMMHKLKGWSGAYDWSKQSEFLIAAKLPVEAAGDMNAIYGAYIENRPKMALLIAYFSHDTGNRSYVDSFWDNELRCYMPRKLNDANLNYIYDFLKLLGYEMSDEEIQLQNGTHPIYDLSQFETIRKELKENAK